MSWLRIGAKRAAMVGVECSPGAISFAAMEPLPGAPRLRVCEHLVGSDSGLPLEQFSARLRTLKLHGRPCNLILPADAYKLVLVEKPAVPDEEMRDAVLFRIRDMIPMALEDAVLDLLHLPADSSRSGKSMVYGVVADRKRIQPLIALVRDAGLVLKTIDVAEMALRNIVERCLPGLASAAVIRLNQGTGTLILLRDESIYLSRQFDLDYAGGLHEQLPAERLILEVQRSLDYFERQMGLLPPDNIYFCGENVTAQKIADTLSDALPGRAELLRVATAVHGVYELDESLLQLCIGAVGAAMRRATAP